MDDTFEQLVDALSRTSSSIHVLRKIALRIEQQTPESFSLFVTQSLQSLLTLKQWTWQQFSHGHHQWIQQPDYLCLFHVLASFYRSFVFTCENIDSDIKALLLLPDNIEQINGVFEQINQCDNDNDPFITLVSLYFNRLSSFLRDNPHYDTSPIICYINEYMGRNYLMTDQFKLYLTQLQQPILLQSIFTAKQLFYMKTCSFSASSYLSAKAQNFPFTAEEMLQHIGNEYLQIINIHSQFMESWSKELLICIAHLTGLIWACCWWGGKKSTQRKILFSSEQRACDLVQSFVHIISYKSFYEKLKTDQLNDEVVLIHLILKFLLDIFQTQNIIWFFRSNLLLPDTLFKIVALSTCNITCLSAYAILGEILTDEKLKELTFADHVGNFFYNILEQGWYHPLKKYKQIPVEYLLRSFAALSKSDAIQQSIADSNKLSLFIEMSYEYEITLDIIWALSFNQDLQQQLRSNTSFIDKLSCLAKQPENEQIRKVTSGILWNLEINHRDRAVTQVADDNTFDVMISYSHKDKVLCQQLYQALIKGGYRVWIDFDQMHGNVMDAMAQAIDRSQTIILCMSEQYRKSNYCRAEAHYAFQRQRKIVPVLMQKHYKPDGWLLFLTGQLLYVDFTKYEFEQAMDMLSKELKAANSHEVNLVTIQSAQDSTVTPVILPIAKAKLILPSILPKNIADWTQTNVQEWLVGNHLIQMSRLLIDFNGRSLLHLNNFIRNGDIKQIIHLLQEDSLRQVGQSLSLTELSCFQSLLETKVDSTFPKANHNIDKKRSFVCCSMM